jgi:RND superfamily putative drug exporter
MELLGEWNWWAPAPLRRLYARISAARASARPEPAVGIID